ncbi:MAG: type II/IV secretion system ATPase subunit [Halobacteriota archaeon]
MPLNTRDKESKAFSGKVERRGVAVDEEEDSDASLLSLLDVKSEELRYSLHTEEQHSERCLYSFLRCVEADIGEYPIPDGYTALERYFVDEPYALISILYSKEQDKYLYHVSEPKLREEEQSLFVDIREKLRAMQFLNALQGGKEDSKERVKRKIEEVLRSSKVVPEADSFKKICYYLVRDFADFGRIYAPMRDKLAVEISCVGYNVFVYHRKYGYMATNMVLNEVEFESVAYKAEQAHLALYVADKIATAGRGFTIKRSHEVIISPVDMIRWGTFSALEMAYLWLCVENRRSILVMGLTASGRTAALNAIAHFIPQTANILSIEETRELNLRQKHWIASVTKVSFGNSKRDRLDMYDLLSKLVLSDEVLKVPLEYLLIGELRGKEAAPFFRAISSGYTAFTTFQADTIDAVIPRLESPPFNVPHFLLESLDVIVNQARVFIGDKIERRNLAIAEYSGMDGTTDKQKTRVIFKRNAVQDTFVCSLTSSKVMKAIAEANCWYGKRLEQELKGRIKLLEFMVARGFTYREFISIIRDFQASPGKVKRMFGI